MWFMKVFTGKKIFGFFCIKGDFQNKKGLPKLSSLLYAKND